MKMKKKVVLTVASSILSLNVLAACGAGNGNNEMIEPDNVRFNNDYENVRYDNNGNGNGLNNREGNGVIDNGYRNGNNGTNNNGGGLFDNGNNGNNGNDDGLFDINNDNNNDGLFENNNNGNNGNGLFNNNNNGNNNVDTPFNMDEEEPDLDEEPTEQRTNNNR